MIIVCYAQKRQIKKLKIVHIDNKSHPMCYNTDIQDNARREEVAGYGIYFSDIQTDKFHGICECPLTGIGLWAIIF